MPYRQRRRRRCHFALGKAYEDLGDDEEAFEPFEIGNSLKRPLVAYDRGQTLARMSSLIDFFTKGRFAEGQPFSWDLEDLAHYDR